MHRQAIRRRMGECGSIAGSASVFFLFLGRIGFAQCEFARLTAHDASSKDLFGQSVSLSHDCAVIGAPRYDRFEPFTPGAVYVYERYGAQWIEQAKLTTCGGESADNFGGRVAIDGDYIAVSSTRDNQVGAFSGAVFVFRRAGRGWVQDAKLIGSDTAPGDAFGQSLAFDEGRILVGSSGRYAGGQLMQRAYLFRRDGSQWIEEAKLMTSDPIQPPFFVPDQRVAMSGDYVALTNAYQAMSGHNRVAAVHVFHRTEAGWQSEATIPPLGPLNAWQGAAIDGEYLVTGPYVYRRNGTQWFFDTELRTSPRVELSDATIADDAIVIAVRGSQARYLFRNTNRAWVFVGPLLPQSGWFDSISTGMVLSSLTTGIGGVGEARVFAIDGDCNLNQTLDACEIVEGSALDVNEDGVPDDCEDHPPVARTDPPDAAIDARQPYDPDGTAAVGWDTIQLIFSGNAPVLTPSDFTLIIEPANGMLTIDKVEIDQDSAWVRLDSPIPPRAWATLTRLVTGETYRFGYLPGDVDGNGFNDQADVFALRDHLDRVRNLPIFSVDVDRSGTVCPLDLMRLIDLDNGADEYATWYGARLGMEVPLPCFADRLQVTPAVAEQRFAVTMTADTDTIAATAFPDGFRLPMIGRSEVHVFHREGSAWFAETVLSGSDSVPNDYFGRALGIFGDRLVVGAPSSRGSGAQAGAAYVFHRNQAGWTEEAKLLTGDPVPVTSFGSTVAIAVDRALVTAFRQVGQTSKGIVYVFRREGTTWTREATLEACSLGTADGNTYDGFGGSLALDEDFAVIGSPDVRGNASDTTRRTGRVHVFRREGTSWTQDAYLTPSVGVDNEQFGRSVALHGDFLFAASRSDGVHPPGYGSVYVFKRDGGTWVEYQRLLSRDSDGSRLFGTSLAVGEHFALISGCGPTSINTESGCTYVFDLVDDRWREVVRLAGPVNAQPGRFGNAVGLSGVQAVISAYLDDQSATNGGAIFLYDLPGDCAE